MDELRMFYVNGMLATAYSARGAEVTIADHLGMPPRFVGDAEAQPYGQIVTLKRTSTDQYETHTVAEWCSIIGVPMVIGDDE